MECKSNIRANVLKGGLAFVPNKLLIDTLPCVIATLTTVSSQFVHSCYGNPYFNLKLHKPKGVKGVKGLLKDLLFKRAY